MNRRDFIRTVGFAGGAALTMAFLENPLLPELHNQRYALGMLVL